MLLHWSLLAFVLVVLSSLYAVFYLQYVVIPSWLKKYRYPSAVAGRIRFYVHSWPFLMYVIGNLVLVSLLVGVGFAIIFLITKRSPIESEWHWIVLIFCACPVFAPLLMEHSDWNSNTEYQSYTRLKEFLGFKLRYHVLGSLIDSVMKYGTNLEEALKEIGRDPDSEIKFVKGLIEKYGNDKIRGAYGLVRELHRTKPSPQDPILELVLAMWDVSSGRHGVENFIERFGRHLEERIEA